jgi:hypothetical protein
MVPSAAHSLDTDIFFGLASTIQVPSLGTVLAAAGNVSKHSKGRKIMNRRTTLTTMTLLCFTVALPAGDAAGQQKTLKDQLAGAWTYVSSEITLPDGAKQPISEFGANPKGILILDAGGRYADIEMRPDRPKFKASGNFRVNTPAAEWGEVRSSHRRAVAPWRHVRGPWRPPGKRR